MVIQLAVAILKHFSTVFTANFVVCDIEKGKLG